VASVVAVLVIAFVAFDVVAVAGAATPVGSLSASVSGGNPRGDGDFSTDQVVVPGSSEDGSSSPLAPLLTTVGCVAMTLLALRAYRRRGGWTSGQMTAALQAAGRDVSAFGDRLAGVAMPLASDAATDYRAAVHSHHRAKSTLEQVLRRRELADVAAALDDGDWRLSCAEARQTGQPLPVRR
jgi:hypothetical protein